MVVSRTHSRAYIAQASVDSSASSTAGRSAFKIEVRFVSGLNREQQQAFERAADRWSRMIIGDLPSVVVADEEISGIVIFARGDTIDGAEKILGQSGPTLLRPGSAAHAAFLPAVGEMTFDAADLQQMQKSGTLEDVVAHEMGHVLGIGTLWARKRLLVAATSANPTFRGRHAQQAYGLLLSSKPQPVPVENLGGRGTRNSHWRESIFGNELMSGFLAGRRNPLSLITVASLADLGYRVDLERAEPYDLPGKSPRTRQPRGGATTTSLALNPGPRLRPTVPRVLPEETLV